MDFSVLIQKNMKQRLFDGSGLIVVHGKNELIAENHSNKCGKCGYNKDCKCNEILLRFSTKIFQVLNVHNIVPGNV